MFEMKNVTPILRIFDEAKAKEFYVDYLEFEIEFEHRFGDNFPLYVGLQKGSFTLHLSEHHGDACPGAKMRIHMRGLKEYHERLAAKDYRYAKPGCCRGDFDDLEMELADPFGNKLWFVEKLE